MSRNRFIQHIQIIEDTETGAKFVIDNQKVAGIVTSILNKLSDENYKLKDDLKECRIRKDIIKEKLVPYHMICDKYHLASSVKLEEYIEKLRRKNRELLSELYPQPPQYGHYMVLPEDRYIYDTELGFTDQYENKQFTTQEIVNILNSMNKENNRKNNIIQKQQMAL